MTKVKNSDQWYTVSELCHSAVKVQWGSWETNRGFSSSHLQFENLSTTNYLLVWASCSSRKCLCTSHFAGWSAARAMSAVMRFSLTEPASSQTERRSKGGWPRPSGWPGPWPCPDGCSLVASLCCCCSMYWRMFTSCTTALMPSPTAWLCRLQLAMRMIAVWGGWKKRKTCNV